MTAPLTDCSPISLSLGFSIPLGTTIFKLSQSITQQWPLSVEVKGRVTHLHLK